MDRKRICTHKHTQFVNTCSSVAASLTHLHFAAAVVAAAVVAAAAAVSVDAAAACDAATVVAAAEHNQ